MSITATNLIVFLSQTHMPQSAAGKGAKAGRDVGLKQNKAGYTATHVACEWTGTIMEKEKCLGRRCNANTAHKCQKS